VCAPEDLDVDPPDVVVILAWALREEIMSQLDGLRRRGTRFLFPLPEVALLS
jgi:hypothetical protein